MEDFHELLAGFDGLEDIPAYRFFLHAGDEVLSDAKLNVCFEQGDADVPQGVDDVLF